MNEEIWKYIETSKDYMISNRGRVKSFVKNKNGSILNQDTGNSGHKRVMIKYPEPRTRHLVHRLVAIAFIENVDNKPIINHIDNDPSNNDVSNLEWCTYSENLIHAERQGRLYESHQNAGKATSEIQKQKKIDLINSKIGTKYNKLTILNLVSVNKSTFCNDYIVLCKCDCGSKLEANFSYIENENIKQCQSCKRETKMKKNYISLVSSFPKTFLHYTVESFDEFDPTIEKRNINVNLKCNNCKSIITKKYNQLRKKDRKHYCTVCNFTQDEDIV